MAYRIDEIEGIGASYREKLSSVSVQTTEDLLSQAPTPSARAALSEKTGISSSLILRWTNQADLMRISGVGPQYAELLEAAGVDTVKELRNRNFENLAATMKDTNDAKKLARTHPAPSVVQAWIEQAKSLEAKVSY